MRLVQWLILHSAQFNKCFTVQAAWLHAAAAHACDAGPAHACDAGHNSVCMLLRFSGKANYNLSSETVYSINAKQITSRQQYNSSQITTESTSPDT